MSNNHRVLNLTTGERLKYKQALKRIEDCVWAWVEKGETARSLSIAEQLLARAEKNRLRAPLESSEIPGIKYVGPTNPDRYQLLSEAREFAANA